MEQRRKNLTQLFIPICLETLLYMLSGMVDTLMLSSVNDQAVGAVGTANTYIGIFYYYVFCDFLRNGGRHDAEYRGGQAGGGISGQTAWTGI